MRSKKVLYNITSNIILQILIVINGFIVPKIIISYFGSNINGLVTSITQFLAYITLLESGFGPVVKSVLYKPLANKDNESILKILKASERFFKRIALVFLLYIVILCIIYPIIVNNNFDNVYTISLIVIIGLSTFAEYFFGMTYQLFLQANQKNYITNVIQIVSYSLSIIAIILLTRIGIGIHGIKLASGLLFMMRPLFLNIYVKKKYNINFKNTDETYNIKQKWDGLAQHIAYVIHTNTDVTILTIFTNFLEVSVYSIYALVVKGLTAIIKAFTSGIDATFGDMIAKKEKENLKVKFSIYELFFNSLNTIIFSSAIVLIVPFVAIYTKGVTDVNYIRWTFGIMLVISEYIWGIRQPYNLLIQAAGHYKETRKGAWIECISNIIISILLVKKYGIIGVAIGTIVAMSIRTIEFLIHASKHILQRSIMESIKKLLIMIIETILIVMTSKFFINFDGLSVRSWIFNAMFVSIIAFAFTAIINCMVFKSDFREANKLWSRLLISKRRKKVKDNE